MGHGPGKGSLLSTKELTLKRFIDKHKDLLVQQSLPQTPFTASKALSNLADLERTTHSRLFQRR
jgi:hypothetical protein